MQIDYMAISVQWCVAFIMSENRSRRERKRRRLANTQNSRERVHIDSGKQRLRGRARQAPGLICIERHIHGRTVILSGTLSVEYDAARLSEWVAEELKTAVNEVKRRGGEVKYSRAALKVITKSTITASEDQALIKEVPRKLAQVAILAILNKVTPEDGSDIIRKAFIGIRDRLRQVES